MDEEAKVTEGHVWFSAETAKVPEGYVWFTAVRLRVGDRMGFPTTAIAIDPDLGCWIDPFAQPESQVREADGSLKYMHDDNLIFIDRTEAGYRVDLTGYKGRPFKAGAKPDPKNGVEWLPVAEVVTPPPADDEPQGGE